MSVQVLTLFDFGLQILMQFELLSIVIIFEKLLFLVSLIYGDCEDLD